VLSSLALKSYLDDVIHEHLHGVPVPGYVAGVLWGDAVTVVAEGTANLTTGASMTPDTAFLIGSITKPIVTSLLLRVVDQGTIDLDDRVVDHLPELCLGDPETLSALTVRHLLNHSSGIDAGDYFPEMGRGSDMVARYVASLHDIGQVHPLGRHISYCNAAFVIAGRLLEVVADTEFDRLLRSEIFDPFGLTRACTTGDEAILGRAAIGHIVDSATLLARPTRRFMLPYSGAPAGTTVIDTVEDLLCFAAVHLSEGRTSEGSQVLSPAAVAAMATPTITSAQLYGYSVGLGWQLPPFGGTRVLAHYGGSYGGVASILVLPDHGFAFAAFGNSTHARPVHERIHEALMTDLLGLPGADRIPRSDTNIDPFQFEGRYERQHLRTTIAVDEDGHLAAHITFLDPEGEADWRAEYSGYHTLPPIPIEPVTPTLCLPTGDRSTEIAVPHALAEGWTFLDRDGAGRFGAVANDRRLSRRIEVSE
jgi:CubicO group peptidase (beta-lactamase class C family)